ncbi:hypothetical protein MCOR25_011223 [Pyricularia grisea]|nr:hypothetical protein MCOR25_011223 [Pyricularia grisea]
MRTLVRRGGRGGGRGGRGGRGGIASSRTAEQSTSLVRQDNRGGKEYKRGSAGLGAEVDILDKKKIEEEDMGGMEDDMPEGMAMAAIPRLPQLLAGSNMGMWNWRSAVLQPLEEEGNTKFCASREERKRARWRKWQRLYLPQSHCPRLPPR